MTIPFWNSFSVTDILYQIAYNDWYNNQQDMVNYMFHLICAIFMLSLNTAFLTLAVVVLLQYYYSKVASHIIPQIFE